MNPQQIFKDKLKGTLGRKLFSSPSTYKLAREVFVKKNRFNFEARRKLTAMGLDQAAEAYHNKKPVAWTSAFFPGELVYIFDLVPFAPEAASGVAASMDLAPDLLKHSDQMGLSSDSCSFHRCAAAGTSLEYFPLPDFLLASSHLCDGAPRLFQYMARRYDRPLYLLDVPFRYSDHALKYVADQLAGIAEDLEKRTGIKLTRERIAEVFDRSNRARSHQLAVSKLRQKVPSPLGGEEGLSYFYLTLLGQGHPETPEIYRTLEEELQKIVDGEVENPEGKEERFRLIWLHLRPYYSSEMIAYLEKELGHKIVAEEMNYVYWPPLDAEKPFLSLAEKVLSHPGMGPLERRTETIRQMVSDYRAHGVIHFSHWGCRQSVGGSMAMKKKFREKDIPFLAIDGDCIDGDSFPWGQALTRLEGFHEVLEQLHA